MGSMLSRSLNTKIAAALIAAFTLGTPLAAPARQHATPLPTASPTPPAEDPAIGRIARREFVAWQAGNVDRTRYAPQTSAKLNDTTINRVATGLGRLGAFVRSEYLGPIPVDSDAPKGINAYLYRMFCTNGTVYERIVIDGAGKVAGIVFMDKLPTGE